MELLGRIQRRYRLPGGYSKQSSHTRRVGLGHVLDDVGPAERAGSPGICLEWVRRAIISGSTDYRRFQAAAMKQRHAIRFPGVVYGQPAAK